MPKTKVRKPRVLNPEAEMAADVAYNEAIAGYNTPLAAVRKAIVAYLDAVQDGSHT
jgi:hypothetical protein